MSRKSLFSCFLMRILPSFSLTLLSIILISSWRSFLSRCISSASIARVRWSFSTPLLENTLALITIPWTPGGTFNDVSLTSPALSPNIALSSLSSGDSWVSPFGVTLPTKISPELISAPILMIPLSSKFFKASSPTFGISLVISSLPSFVSRETTSNSSIWTEV